MKPAARFTCIGQKMIADGELAEAFAELAPSILNLRDFLSLG
jgi:hypothetical protein